ncbi:Rrp15p-domain-containing protein [Entophlyctis helioformis]|nr:Rrp15p-domain-containing protein [Entophlyctis helioformis]
MPPKATGKRQRGSDKSKEDRKKLKPSKRAVAKATAAYHSDSDSDAERKASGSRSGSASRSGSKALVSPAAQRAATAFTTNISTTSSHTPDSATAAASAAGATAAGAAKATTSRKSEPAKKAAAPSDDDDDQDDIDDLDMSEGNDDDDDQDDDLEGLDDLEDDEYGDEEGDDDDEEDDGVVDSNGMTSKQRRVERAKAAAAVRAAEFASTMSKLLASSKGKADEKPILSRKKHIEAQLDDAKLEAKARRILSAEKKLRIEIGRVKPSHATMDHEKKMRKLATRGVVQLFNAIRAAQKSTQELQGDGIQKNSTEAPSVSKETFINTLKEESARKALSDAAKKTGARASGAGSQAKTATDETAAGVVPWVSSDFAMKAPKHWDQEDEEENVEF